MFCVSEDKGREREEEEEEEEGKAVNKKKSKPSLYFLGTWAEGRA